MHWTLRSDSQPKDKTELKKILLANRQISSEVETDFFSPPSPLDFSLADVGIDQDQTQKAVDRILLAKQRKELVIVFGDYDADGVCATAVLWETLHSMGVKAIPFIPSREKHGYGISHRALDDLLKQYQPAVIITVDNGIVAHEPIQRLTDLGVDVIVTDHHLPEIQVNSYELQVTSKDKQYLKGKKLIDQKLTIKPSSSLDSTQFRFPNAFAIVHTTQLCGATVAWMLAKELAPQKVEHLVDLCGIATIADQMILQGANRSFAHHGVKALQTTERVGIKNLCQIAGIQQEEITTYTINFALAPRINAMGRIASAMDALRALCTKNEKKSLQLIEVLQTTNQERQVLTYEKVELAKQDEANWKSEHLIIVESEEYHEGVIGLIAGRLCEEFYKPAIAISIGETVSKGSARSVAGVNIVELIRQVREDLLDVGGHPMACGFSVSTEKVQLVKQKLLALAKECVDKKLLSPTKEIECLLNSSLISLDTHKLIKSFEPFGNGNSEPVFGFKELQVEQVYAVGREKQHLKLQVTSQKLNVKSFDCIAFGFGHLESKLRQGVIVDLAGMISINEWNGRQKVQLVVKDVVVGK